MPQVADKGGLPEALFVKTVNDGFKGIPESCHYRSYQLSKGTWLLSSKSIHFQFYSG